MMAIVLVHHNNNNNNKENNNILYLCISKINDFFFYYCMHVLRGSTPFEDMIFYLWTDLYEICTAYVKLEINHIIFMKNFRFSI